MKRSRPSQLRTHSRSSSHTKIAGNLQLTQRDSAPAKSTEKSRKSNTNLNNGYESYHKQSHQRIPSTTHIASAHNATPPSKRATPSVSNKQTNRPKTKAGFTFASADSDEDEDEWVSSESGAATPSQVNSHSDDEHDESGAMTPVERSHLSLAQNMDSKLRDLQAKDQPAPKETEFTKPPPTINRSAPSLPGLAAIIGETADVKRTRQTMHESLTNSQARPQSKRLSASRPPSLHSSMGKADPNLRPHPLIRGHSYGQPSLAIKPTPLAPLTALSSESSGTYSPRNSQVHHSSPNADSSPPESQGGGSPSSAVLRPSTNRRTSVSSASSVVTLPAQPLTTRDVVGHQRTRTLSALPPSASSSSAALSSLAHLPAVSRPPSPQTVSFFPTPNPRAHMDAIHPLLPEPALQTHLTVLRYRQPLRESFDRVLYAKQKR